jgi:Rod binding domain-containing protein
MMSSDLALLRVENDKFKMDRENLGDKKLREKTDQFEAMIIKTLLDTAMKDSNPLFGKDAGDKIYQSMFRDEISKQSAGSFGLSQTLFDFLKKNS